MRNSAVMSNQTLRRANPSAAMHMTPISITFTRRTRRDFSYLSASCPAVAENRKKGKMKTPPAIFTSVSVESVKEAAPNANRMTSAFLKTLSFSAP